MFGRKKIAMLVAEFLGTGVLTLVVLSVQRSTIGIPYFIALAAGLAVAALSVVFGGISGGHFNPAITLGMWTARKVRTVPALTYVVAQLLGGWAAYGVYTYFVNNSLQKLTSHYTARIMIAEAVGVFIFGLVWAAVAAQRLAVSYKGAGLTLGVIVASSASLALLNPAVALGTRAWGGWGWNGLVNYVVGPLVGAVVAFNLYELFFADGGHWIVNRGAGATASVASVSAAPKSTSRPAAKRSTAKKPARRTAKK